MRDAKIDSFAQACKSYGKPILFGFCREMNGNWYDWSEIRPINTNNFNANPSLYSFTNMWVYVHDRVVKYNGCTNLTWVWYVDQVIATSNHQNPITHLYPGDAYVDWVGMDVYNTYLNSTWPRGRWFTNCYGPTYEALATNFPTKPILVGECGSDTSMTNTPKAAWITDCLHQMAGAFPNIRAFTWMNWNCNGFGPDSDWPIEGGTYTNKYTDPNINSIITWDAVNAYSNGVSRSPFYISNIFTNQANIRLAPSAGATIPSIQPILLLPAPTNVAAAASNGTALLSWSAVVGATNYNVYRSTSGGSSTFAWLARSTGTNCSDGTTMPGSTYYYFIAAQNLAGESVDSAIVSVNPPVPPPAPDAPSDLVAAAVATNRIELAWADHSTNETGFKVEWSSDNLSFNLRATVGAGATNYVDAGLAPGTTLYYRIRATGDGGDSAPSNVASATTFATNVTVVARFVTSPILVDGSLPAPTWDLSATLAKTTLGTRNNTVTFGVLWDSNYLYVGVQVLDTVLINDSANVWDDDSVDVYIDGTHNKGTTYDSHDRFFQKGWNDAALRETGGRITGVLHAWANIPGGYNLELAIPWSNIGVTAAADMTIGFDVANNDDDNGAARDSQCIWSGTASNYINTSAFGDLYLSSLKANFSSVTSVPTNLTAAVSGNTLTLSWPANYLGWRLQSQTNSVDAGLGTNWVTVPGSTGTKSFPIAIDPANGSVFYRLAYPNP
jgi:hypothetical protein